MANEKVKCASCGAVSEVPEKPAPTKAVEMKQIRFNCRECGAANRRDGTAGPNKDYAVKIERQRARAAAAAAPVKPPALPGGSQEVKDHEEAERKRQETEKRHGHGWWF